MMLHNDNVHRIETDTNRSPRGFTLLEVLIAMAILATTLVVVFQSQSQSVSMVSDARFLTTASLLANSTMTEMETLDSDAVSSDRGEFGEDYPDYSWEVEVTDTEIEQVKRITVTVTNERMKKNNTYELTLYRFVSK